MEINTFNETFIETVSDVIQCRFKVNKRQGIQKQVLSMQVERVLSWGLGIQIGEEYIKALYGRELEKYQSFLSSCKSLIDAFAIQNSQFTEQFYAHHYSSYPYEFETLYDDILKVRDFIYNNEDNDW